MRRLINSDHIPDQIISYYFAECKENNDCICGMLLQCVYVNTTVMLKSM